MEAVLIKKILIVVVVLAAACIIFVDIAYQKAPGFLRNSLEKAFGKEILIREVDYRFPGIFELNGFEIRERGVFAGETSFSADRVRLEVFLASVFQKSLAIKKIEAEDADVIVRKRHGKLTHLLSDVAERGENAPGSGPAGPPAGRTSRLPLEIRQLDLRNGNFQFIDYDAAKGGFVVVLEKINAEISGLSFPCASAPASYKIQAGLFQGRDQRPARFRSAGWSECGTLDADTHIEMNGIYLPYFQPYISQVTQAVIQEGYLDGRVSLRVDSKDLTADADFEMMSLLFQSYEPEEGLFGLKADEILAFLKDSSGRLRLQATVKWRVGDPSVRTREVIRRGIEKSLKRAVFGNLSGVATGVIQKYGDEDARKKNRNAVDDTVKKIKDFLAV